MYYITLDTNTWIYLANGTEPVKLLNYIRDEVKNKNIVILLPTVTLNEWNLHKNKTVRPITSEYFKQIDELFSKILKLLGDKNKRGYLDFLLVDDEDKTEDNFEIYAKKIKERREDVEKAIEDNINLIDDLLNIHSVKIDIKPEIYIKAGDYALEKKAPFGKKNSFADALILFSFLDYVLENKLDDSMFISYNTDDYCEKANKGVTLHKDLIMDFENANSKYYKYVGEALNTIKEGIISKEEQYLIEELKLFEISNKEVYCNECSETGETNPIYFTNSSLSDERNQLDPNQLQFDFGEDFNIPYQEPIKSIQRGSCSWCGVLHIKCVECNHIQSILKNNYNEYIHCENCNLIYMIYVQSDYGYVDYEISIHSPKIKCEKCGDEFYREELTENLCINCEDFYSYEN